MRSTINIIYWGICRWCIMKVFNLKMNFLKWLENWPINDCQMIGWKYHNMMAVTSNPYWHSNYNMKKMIGIVSFRKKYLRLVGGSNHSPLALGASILAMWPPSRTAGSRGVARSQNQPKTVKLLPRNHLQHGVSNFRVSYIPRTFHQHQGLSYNSSCLGTRRKFIISFTHI